MQQDTWTNTKTNTTLGITGALGSPRGWLRRALDVANLDDTTFHATSITPHEISVAGVWYKPVTHLPITGEYRELFRWFDIPAEENIYRRTNKPLLPAVGIAATVPQHEIMHWIKLYQRNGAAWTWWKTPENRSIRASESEKGQRRQLDYPTIYAMLDKGMTPTQISHQLDIPTPNIDYVKKKWLAGAPPTVYKNKINVSALRADYQAGMRAPALAEKYNTSESYVYRMMRGVKELSS